MERGVKIAELTRMASNLRIFRPDAALMVLPCMGSLNDVTMCVVFRTASTKAGNFSLSFSAPMHTITVNLPGLLSGFKISQSFTGLLETSCHSPAANIPPET
ncbi:unnamed protein product [Sphagnum jensenii]|uniref:Uncharacterized protein n=1 Tax=Sphagnum jensenii TaxID=128206 RepID=A0ABP0VX62_9BRYO